MEKEDSYSTATETPDNNNNNSNNDGNKEKEKVYVYSEEEMKEKFAHFNTRQKYQEGSHPTLENRGRCADHLQDIVEVMWMPDERKQAFWVFIDCLKSEKGYQFTYMMIYFLIFIIELTLTYLFFFLFLIWQ